MKMYDRISSPAVGAASLLTVFAVLCLTVFALLSLSSAQAEKRMSESSARSVADYYLADAQAEEIFARLRNGELPPAVEQDSGYYHYSCPVSQSQSLEVTLYCDEGHWSVLRWQTEAHAMQANDTLPVWGSGTGG